MAGEESDFVDSSLAEVVETWVPLVVAVIVVVDSGKIDDAGVTAVAYPMVADAEAVEDLTGKTVADVVEIVRKHCVQDMPSDCRLGKSVRPLPVQMGVDCVADWLERS